ncbi:MAG TPA: succinate dehydrogenase assembly factor 2 [Mizugakiibacter sp.]|nr:succinate dehydrogenase assembly factor 2 [Mizugakiibacter sp.]
MTDQESIPALGRLRWRCRRGTSELDTLLGDWLEQDYPGSSHAKKSAFSELLEVQDPDLWDWLVGRSRPPRTDWKELIDAIRAHHSL